jgi:hypothetical protein
MEGLSEGMFCLCWCRLVRVPTAEALCPPRKEKISRIQKFCPFRTQLFRAARLLAGKVCLGALAKKGSSLPLPFSLGDALAEEEANRRWRRAASFRWLVSLIVMAVAARAFLLVLHAFFVAPPAPPFPSPTFGGKVCAREHKKKQNSPLPELKTNNRVLRPKRNNNQGNVRSTAGRVRWATVDTIYIGKTGNCFLLDKMTSRPLCCLPNTMMK